MLLRLASALAILLLGIGVSFRAAAQNDISLDAPAPAPATATGGSGMTDTPTGMGEKADSGTDKAGDEGEDSEGKRAEEEGGTENAVGSEKPQTFIDTAHARISRGVLATAQWLDSFFSDPRFENESSETRVRVRFSLFQEEGERFEYDGHINARLDLPFLKRKFHLLIAGDPEEEEDLKTLSGRKGEAPELISANENTSASLRYFLVDTLERNISLRSGVKWRSGVPTVFLEPRYRLTIPLDSWQFRFTQSLIGFTDGRTGVRTIFDFERKLNKSLFFRTSTEGSWASDEDGYFYSESFSLYKTYSSRRVVIYGWGNSFRTEPVHRLERVALSVRYRQRILRDWLFYEVIPQISFPNDRDYQAVPGIMLRLEMVFGYYRKLPPAAR